MEDTPYVASTVMSELKSLRTLGMKYLAKDKNGELCAFTHKPEKDKVLGLWMKPVSSAFAMDLPNFLKINKMVNWKDSKPVYILEAMGGAEILIKT